MTIDASGWERLLVDLVRTPSHRGIPRQEERAAAVLAEWLHVRGIEVALDEVAPGRPNVIARVAGADPGRTLALCGHTDTVPLNEGEPGAGFSGEIRDGRLFGRGACDMKGAISAMASALVALAAPGGLPAGQVVLAAIVDEEMESLGAERLVATGFRADGAIVGEPTENRLALGHRGLEWIEVSFRGRAAHGGTPEAGVNSIVAASHFVRLVEDELKPVLAQRVHTVLGPPTINLGTIRGGDQPSTVAAACAITLDRRTVPGETYAGVMAELDALLAKVEGAMPGIRTGTRRVPGGMATLEHRPTVIDAAHPLAAAVERARARVTGRAEAPTSFPAWTDGALLAGFANIPCVVIGPGELAVAHSPRENVPLSEVADAARIYAGAAVQFCGGRA